MLGPYRLKNGDQYHGEWLDGVRHGRGVLISQDFYYEGKNIIKEYLKMIFQTSQEEQFIKMDIMKVNLKKENLTDKEN